MTHPIPETMKSPRDSRPGVWPMGAVPGAIFGGVMQVHLTRNCDLACTNCTEGSQLSGPVYYMSTALFEQAMESLKDYPGVVGIFGGNPVLAKNFAEICEVMKKYIPFERRGIWTNRLFGKGAICRKTFNPDVSNCNVHQSQEAYEEFLRDWPLSQPKGLDHDSRHSPPYVAMRDLDDMNDDERWSLIGNCSINQYWSAMICVFRGELRGYFCEIAGAQSMLHQHEADYPDTGLKVEPGWWEQGMDAFDHQVRKHCFDCGVPLNGYGDYANHGTVEQVSKTHAAIYKLKRPAGKTVKIVTKRAELGNPDRIATKYLPTEHG